MFKRKQAIVLLLIFVALTFVSRVGSINSSTVQTSQNDANSGADAPDVIPVNLGSSYSGSIGANLTSTTDILGDSDYFDYYTFNLASTGNLSLIFQLTNNLTSSLSSVSILRDGSTVSEQSYWFDDPVFNFVIPISVTGSYVLEVFSYSDIVLYTFELNFHTGSFANQNDAGTPGDASTLSPKSVALDTTYNGTIGNGAVDSSNLLDMNDVYNISLPGQGYLSISASISSPDSIKDFTVIVNTPGGDEIVSDTLDLYDSILTSEAPIFGPGLFQFQVESTDWNATYTFSLSFQSALLPSQNDTNSTGDASAIYSESPIIPVNSSISGSVGQGLLEISTQGLDNSDIYRLEPTDYGMLKVNLSLDYTTDTYASVYLSVYNESDLYQFPVFSMYASSYSTMSYGNVTLDKGSHYYIEISTYSKQLNYSSSISFMNLQAPNPPTSTSTSQQQNTSSISSSSKSAAFDITTLVALPLVVLIIQKKKRILKKK